MPLKTIYTEHVANNPSLVSCEEKTAKNSIDILLTAASTGDQRCGQRKVKPYFTSPSAEFVVLLDSKTANKVSAGQIISGLRYTG
jgi:hypothetical protein